MDNRITEVSGDDAVARNIGMVNDDHGGVVEVSKSLEKSSSFFSTSIDKCSESC